MERAPALKSRLLRNSCVAALALGGMLASNQAAAQAFQATPSIVQGTVNVDRSVPNQDTITVTGLDAVIDWDTAAFLGNFLPAGNTAIFQGGVNETNFGVINRILPNNAGSPAVFDGTVISQLQDATGPTGPGGWVMFYSSTGILVTANATFDFGGLVLTSTAPDINGFTQFISGTGPMDFTGVFNDTTSIQIVTGASFTGSAEGSALVVTAPQITMNADAYINGSTAYIAAERLSLSYASGLFDIFIPVGTNVANAIDYNGNTGGPASTGAGDNHVIYAVAQAQQNPISMLFSGNLGFDAAVVAGAENGEVILSANYHVNGTNVQNGFTSADPRSLSSASIFVENVTVTSDIQVHSSNFAQISGAGGTTSITGDVFLYGRDDAQLVATSGGLVDIVSNVFVGAQDIGLTTGGEFSLAELDGNAGNALVAADSGGSITINGSLTLDATARMGRDQFIAVTGNSQGGTAQLIADDGDVLVTGDLFVRADGLGNTFAFAAPPLSDGGNGTGGNAGITVANLGTLDIGGNTAISSSGTAIELPGPDNGGTAGVGSGGSSTVTADTGGTLHMFGSLTMSSEGFGSASNLAVSGAGLAGSSILLAANAGSAQIDGFAIISANAFGGSSLSTGTGGDGTAGLALIQTLGGTVTIGDFGEINAVGNGGDGNSGGMGDGGSAGIEVLSGSVDITGNAQANSIGFGGTATNGFGGLGGDGEGGASYLRTNGLNGASGVTIGGNLDLISSGFGGDGGPGDGSSTLAGNGGAGFGGFTNIVGEAGATLDVTGTTGLTGAAFGGAGGTGGGGTGGIGLASTSHIDILTGATMSFANNTSILTIGTGGSGETGGDGFGGSSRLFLASGAQIDLNGLFMQSAGSGGSGLAFAGGNAESFASRIELRPGTTANLTGNVVLTSRAFGGDGVTTGGGANDSQANADARILVDNADFNASTATVSLQSRSFGGDATGINSVGGSAQSGFAEVRAQNGALADFGGLQIVSTANGGTGPSTNGGDASIDGGGAALIASGAGTEVNIGNLVRAFIIASAVGGDTTGSDTIGGPATGGTAELVVDGATVNFPFVPDLQNLQIQPAVGSVAVGGGSSADGGAGGDAFAGDTSISISNGGVVTGSKLVAQTVSLGGSSLSGPANIDGGSASGGQLLINLGNGATFDAALSANIIATGGDGSGTGNGGNAAAGDLQVLVNNSLFDLFDESTIESRATGGSGANGGSGIAGPILVSIINGAIFDFGDLSSVDIFSTGTGGNGTTQGGNGEAGSVDLVVDGGTVQGDDLLLRAEGIAGSGQGGGLGLGAPAAIFADNNGTLTLTNLAVEATATGGDGGAGAGGEANQALATIDLLGGSSLTALGDVLVQAELVGGNATGGNAGDASGFDMGAYIYVDGSAIDVSGDTQILTSANGGNSFADNFLNGDAFGGASSIEIVNGSTGQFSVLINSSTARGGGFFTDTLNSLGNGGDATGGVANVLVRDVGSTLTVDHESSVQAIVIGGATNGQIGQPVPPGGTANDGIGGSATGGTVSIVANQGGTITLLQGDSGFYDNDPFTEQFRTNRVSTFGGSTTVDGGTAGSASDPLAILTADGGSSITMHDIIFGPAVGGGVVLNNAANASGSGGSGATLSVFVGNGSTLDLTNVTLGNATSASGGFGTGQAGIATPGSSTVNIFGSDAIFRGESRIGMQVAGPGFFFTPPSGIVYPDATPDATSGNVVVTVNGGSTVQVLDDGLGTPGTLTISSAAIGGPASAGHQGGSGDAGSAVLAIDNSTLTGGALFITSAGTAGADENGANGGAASSGLASLQMSNNADLQNDSVEINSTANSSAGGTAEGGFTFLSLLNSPNSLDSGSLSLLANGQGGTTNTAGHFALQLINSNVSVQSFLGQAEGELRGGANSILADNSTLQILDTGDIMVRDNLSLETLNGGLILGGTSPANPTAIFTFRTFETLFIAGDDDNLISFGSDFMTLTSADIDVGFGARFGANTLALASNNTSSTAVIGGGTPGAGYSLTDVEGARIEAGEVSFFGPQIDDGNDPFGVDVELRDLTIFGSLDDGVHTVILDSDGVVSVTGPVEYVLAGPDDSFSVFAGERIQFVLDANATIYMVDDQDVLTGTLTLSAPSIFAADSDLLDQIIADPLLPGLQDLLAEEPGFSEPGAYIEADTVFLFGEDYIYTQNWGASGVFSAVAVGPGGLTVAQEGDALPNLLNAIVFGIQVNGLNDFTSNANFFRLVTFNMEPSNHFTNESTLNLCFIVSGVCGSGIPVGEGQIEPPITNSTYTAPPPLVTRETTEIVEQNEEDNSFGLDFPSMFSAETVDEQTNVTQPVTSGGDNALYGDPLEDDENDAQ